MFRPTGVFEELMCPDVSCDRPYCQFWHEPASSSDTFPTVQEEASGFSGYSATMTPMISQGPSESFSGYSASLADQPLSLMNAYAPNSPLVTDVDYASQNGYNRPPSPKYSYILNPDDSCSSSAAVGSVTQEYVPTPIVKPVSTTLQTIPEFSLSKVKKETCDEDEIVVLRQKIVKPKNTNVSTEATAAVESAKTIASETVALIDKQIEELMKLRKQAVTTTDSLKSSGPLSHVKVKVEPQRSPKSEGIDLLPEPPISGSTERRKPEYDPAAPVKYKYKPSLSGYTPTPLADLLRQKEEDNKNHRKEEHVKRKHEVAKVKKSVSVDELFGEDDEPQKKIIRTGHAGSAVLTTASHSSSKMSNKPTNKPVIGSTSQESGKRIASGSSGITASSSSLSKSTVSDKVEKGKGLTSEQLLAAKARSARPGASMVVRQLQKSGNRKIPSAAEQMLSRFKAKEAASSSKKAGAPRPITQEQLYGNRSTVAASTSAKGEQRTARKVINSSLKPVLLEPTNGKLPMFTRTKMLERIYNELLAFLPQNEALEQAPLEEKWVMDKVSSKNAYIVAIPNAIKRMRDAHTPKPANGVNHAVSHSRVLAGKAHDQITIKAKGPKNDTELTEDRLYKAFEDHYLLTEDQMSQNSYPRFVDENRVYIEPSPYDKKRNKKTFVADYEWMFFVMERLCSRCSTEYTLSPIGAAKKAECIYHLKSKARLPGKPRNTESTHPCCGGDASVAGCQVALTHVSDTLRNSELESFRTAPEPSNDCDPRSKKLYALDCEMVYTVWGPALARLTVVDINEKVVLDEIVKPNHLVVDFNTTFSGITANQLETATCTLKEAQDRLFTYINNKSILIGHSLESDLKALRIVHRRVVDTSVLYPHRVDNEKKRGLKDLAFDKLKKIIQEDVGGHDSKEDSVVALQLAVYKAKFDGKI